ncbi:kinase-like domain-containing protein [Xylaria digitata]|nr:kinase-like domain-containing protein [Xylaria digitata]
MSFWSSDSQWDDRVKDRVRHKNYMALRNYREGRKVDLDDYIELPRRGTPPEVFYPAVEQYGQRFLPSARDKFDLDKITNLQGLPQNITKAWLDNRRMKRYFSTEYPRLRYKKCLGWGGNGMAAAFDEINENGQNIYRNSEHIVQILSESGQGLLENTGGNDDDEDDDDDDDDDGIPSQRGRKRQAKPHASSSKKVKTGQLKLNVFITEMLENGDLTHFLQKVVQFNERTPNAVLWRFFLCLIKMCIGLAYPPDRIEERKNLPPPIPETIVASARPRREIHFDFDPRNIFIGRVGQGSGHDLTPVLKLGDFGLCTEILPRQSDFYYERLRMHGKLGWLSPEQFCLDWDYILPDTYTIHNHPIAGNYGIHTNIWAVGYVMETLITLCYPASPPRPTESTRVPPPGKQKYFTYGGHLGQDRYSWADQDLISIIMRCQAHLPADRPTLAELEQAASYVIQQRGNFGMSNQQIQQWVNKILHEPPPNPVPVNPQPAQPAQPARPAQPAEIIGNRPRNLIRPQPALPLRWPPPALPLAPPGGQQRPQRRPLVDRGQRPEPWAYAGGNPPQAPAGPPPQAIPPNGPFPQGPFPPYPQLAPNPFQAQGQAFPPGNNPQGNYPPPGQGPPQ